MLAVVLVVFLILNGSTANGLPSKKDSQFVEHLDNWMGQLPAALRDVPLINLAIPGSHDSMSYGITGNAAIETDAEPVINRIYKFAPLLVRHWLIAISKNAALAPDADPAFRHLYKVVPWIVRRWVITQDLSAAQQLEAGVRYFDLRFSLKRMSGQTLFHFVHGLFAQVVQEPFNEILSFLNAHPKEFVILDCQHFYQLDLNEFDTLSQEIRNIFGNKIYGPLDGSIKELTLNIAERMEKQILVIFRSKEFNPEDFWPTDSWPTPWPNQYKVEKLQAFLEDSLLERTYAAGYVTQCVITPPAHFIMLRFYSSLRDSCAESVRREMFDWIADKRPGEYDGEWQSPTSNVFIADFVNLNQNEFCKLVVGLNAKLLG